jgi:hypothetical protein
MILSRLVFTSGKISDIKNKSVTVGTVGRECYHAIEEN